MKIGSKRDINKDRKKLPDVPKVVASADQHETTISHNLKMLTEKHNDEKLAITFLIIARGLIAYQFWQKINGIIINHNRWSRSKCILAFSDNNFVFSRLTDHGAEEHKRHDLALEKLQRARAEWNKDRMKRLDFINKRLREKNEEKAYISNAGEAMLEYYHVFAKK